MGGVLRGWCDHHREDNIHFHGKSVTYVDKCVSEDVTLKKSTKWADNRAQVSVRSLCSAFSRR